MDTQHAVLDLIARSARMENAMNLQSIAHQSQMLAICNLQSTLERYLVAASTAPPASTLLVPVPLLNPLLSPPSNRSGSREPSLEQQRICAFTGCPSSEQTGCSAAKSVRHMQHCVHCPEVSRRYHDIALHMLNFKKHPQVCVVDMCCWCCQMWNQTQNPDNRSRHRTACHRMALMILKVANTCLCLCCIV